MEPPGSCGVSFGGAASLPGGMVVHPSMASFATVSRACGVATTIETGVAVGAGVGVAVGSGIGGGAGSDRLHATRAKMDRSKKTKRRRTVLFLGSPGIANASLSKSDAPLWLLERCSKPLTPAVDWRAIATPQR